MARGGESGGIIGLVALIEEHGSALDYDLLTLTRYSLDDIGESLPWGRLLNFVKHLPVESALLREIEPDMTLWRNGQAADILADVYDLLQSFMATYINANSKKRARKLKPYPRPWMKPKLQHFGKDPIPVSKFNDWWEGRG